MCISILNLSSLFILFIYSAFSLCFWLPYFSPKSFGFFCIRLMVCVRVISTQLLIECSFVVLECPVLSVFFLPFVDISLIFHLSSVLLWFISSSCIVIFSRVAFSFLFLYIRYGFPLFYHFRLFSSAFSVDLPNLVFDFSFMLSEGIANFSHKLILLPA